MEFNLEISNIKTSRKFQITEVIHNNLFIKGQKSISREILKFFELNENMTSKCQMHRKCCFEGKCIALNAYIEKKKTPKSII